MSRPNPQLTEDGHDLAEKLLGETREELLRADGKAQILFAVSGVVIGVVLGGVLAGNWRPQDLDDIGELAWWLGVTAAAIGLGALLIGIWPRLIPSAPGRIAYFEDIRRYNHTGQLVPHLNQESANKQRDVEQLLQLSKVAGRKYVAVRIAVIALVAAAALCVGAALIG